MAAERERGPSRETEEGREGEKEKIHPVLTADAMAGTVCTMGTMGTMVEPLSLLKSIAALKPTLALF